MATSAFSNLSGLETNIKAAFYERLADIFSLFNANGNGTIIMQPGIVTGDQPNNAFWDKVATVTRRDRTSTSARTRTGHTKDVLKSVVLNRAINDDIHLSALLQDGGNIEEYARNVGVNFADDKMANALGAALSGLVGAILSESNAVSDVSGGTNTMTLARLNTAKAKFGDKRGTIRGVYMHSTPYNALVAEIFGSAANAVIDVGNGLIRNDATLAVLGAPVFVTDDAALDAGSSDYYTLLLVDGAARVTDHETLPIMQKVDTQSDNAILEHYGEYNLELFVKGYDYDGGTANPTEAQLATNTNWTNQMSSVKNTAGILLKTDG